MGHINIVKDLKKKIREQKLGEYLVSLTNEEITSLLIKMSYLDNNQMYVDLRTKLQKSKENFDLTQENVVYFLCNIYNDAFAIRLDQIHEIWEELTLIKLDEERDEKLRAFDEDDKKKTKEQLIKLLDEETDPDLYYRFRIILEHFYKYHKHCTTKKKEKTVINSLNKEIKELVLSYAKVNGVD